MRDASIFSSQYIKLFVMFYKKKEKVWCIARCTSPQGVGGGLLSLRKEHLTITNRPVNPVHAPRPDSV